MNTFGLFSINSATININWNRECKYSRSQRNLIVTGLRIHNLVLNILGYLGGQIGFLSGCVRIGTGLSIIATTLAIGERDAKGGVIIRRLYEEALVTGMAQIIRGFLESFFPHGRIVNGSLDLVCTVVNLSSEFEAARPQTIDEDEKNWTSPHRDTQYPLPLSFLGFV